MIMYGTAEGEGGEGGGRLVLEQYASVVLVMGGRNDR